MNQKHHTIMKLLKTLPLIAVIITLFAACNKENEYHTSRFLRPGTTALYVYADQYLDSISFETTESYTLSTNASWCRVPESYKQFVNPYSNAIILCYAWLEFEANKSDEIRGCIVHLDAGDYSVDAYVMQFPFLCITNPVRQGEVLFPLTCEAKDTEATLSFTTFADWTLKVEEGDWVALTVDSGSSGSNDVKITMQPNTTDAERSATIVLTSRGISDRITVQQSKPIEEEEEKS